MKNKKKGIFLVIHEADSKTKTFPPNQYDIRIDIYSCNKGSNLIIALMLSKNDWGNLLNFLRNTTDRNSIPPKKMAFCGFNINANKVFYISKKAIEGAEDIAQNYLERNKNNEHYQHMVERMNKMVNFADKEKTFYKKGEILASHVFLINGQTEVTFGREDFKRFREECILFDSK